MLSPEITRVRDAAIQWLREQYRRLRNSRITPTDVIQRGKTSDFPSLGKMYFYAYDPKTKAKLKHYDTFPLVIPIESYSSTKFLGINFHYLPYNLRTQLMNTLIEQVDDEQNNFTVKYSDIKGAVRYKPAVPCLHRYDLNNVRSNIINVEADEWLTAIYLPVERFQKQSKSTVWQDSRARIARL